MKKKSLKKFLIPSVSAALIMITGIILACADFDYADFYTSFFAPETSHIKEAKPFFRSLNKFYGDERFETTKNNFDSINIVEWRDFFGGKISRADMKFLVYQSRIGEIDSLIFYLKDNKFPALSYLRYNSLYSITDKAVAKEFLYYLGFAKRCEPFATYTPEWWDNDAKSKDPRNNTVPMLKFIEGGSKALANVKSDFIRQRYIFQITRLYFNAGEYSNCVTYYNAHADAFTTENTVKYRTMGYAAGAYYQLKNYSQANYLYALAYDKCSEMKISSFLSFHPQEESDWDGSLQLAKNTREKEALWHLLGIYADPLRAMKEIYKMDPKSDLLDVLLVRAVNIAEESFLPGQGYFSEKKDSGYVIKSKEVDNELLSFLSAIADKKNTNKPYLWDLTTGYLYIAANDFKQGEKYLKNAEKEAREDALVSEQIRAFRLVSKIEQYGKPTEQEEAELARELKWLRDGKHEEGLRYNEICSWALHRLSEKYRTFENTVKAQCLDYTVDKEFYNDQDKMSALISLMDKPTKSEFERFILTVHPYSRADLFEYQAIDLIYQYKFREALDMFDQCKGSGDGKLLADPFIIHINDCHDCDHQSGVGDGYTKYSFVKRMTELQEFSSGDSKKLAQNYFQLANGLYNMTYFGNARLVYDTKLIDHYTVDFDYDTDRKQLMDAIYNCTKAEEYYRKAMELSIDNEFKAKCCFMAAKCEQNAYYCSSAFNYKMPVHSGKYFKQLQENFPKTSYYREVLKECGYFSIYQTQWMLKHPK
ncbi:MAG TPA: hypothetical protein VIH57_07595 [Bacteroidales bacterium]